MNNQDSVGLLAGGASYRVTPFMVQVIESTGAPGETIDRNLIKEVTRKGNTVTIKRSKGKDVALEGASLDDAGRLEMALRPGAAGSGQPPVVVVKKGGGFGRFLMFGCGGLIALVIVVVAIAAAASSGGSDDKAQSSGTESTPGQPGTNRGDVHVSLAEGASGVIFAERNDNKKSKVTILAIRDNATSTNQFSKPAEGKKYWAVQVEVENVGTAEVTSLDWKLRDSKNQEQNQTFAAGIGESLQIGTLTPGGKTTGWIIFQIDSDASPKWLRADPNVLAKNDLYFDAPGQ